MKYSSATSPVWQNAERSMITLMVKFDNLPEAVPFAASPDDPEEHGRELFYLANAGEFGPVAAYVPPTEQEIAQATNPAKRLQQMTLCTSKVQHWEMMGDFSLADKWRQYYRALALLEATEAWPIVEVWPDAPAE